MRRMPIPGRSLLLSSQRDAPPGVYAGLVRISPGYPPAGGRLHTCYSPVRRSPAEGPKPSPAAPRLACVRPVASVHPEPGSNSPLFGYLVFFLFSSKRQDSQLLRFLPGPRRTVSIAARIDRVESLGFSLLYCCLDCNSFNVLALPRGKATQS